MKFLVILISLTINYLWLKDFDRFDDAWFFRFRSRMEALTVKLEAGPIRWIAALLATYGLPLVLLALLLWFVDGAMLGLPTMLVHILVLLVAFDRTQPGKLAQEFLQHWKQGDAEACWLHLEQEMQVPKSQQPEDMEALGDYFSKLIVYRFFERMFVMFFWYMLTGPLGILCAYITYQLRDSHGEDQPEDEINFIAWLVTLLEWIPVRLLALTFSLAGNFVLCFESLRASLWVFERDADHAGWLYGYAKSALRGAVDAEADEFAEFSSTQEDPARVATARHIEALVSLLERAQAIWLVALALLTIFAI